VEQLLSLGLFLFWAILFQPTQLEIEILTKLAYEESRWNRNAESFLGCKYGAGLLQVSRIASRHYLKKNIYCQERKRMPINIYLALLTVRDCLKKYPQEHVYRCYQRGLYHKSLKRFKYK